MRPIMNKTQFIALFIALFAVTAFTACSDVAGPDSQIVSESFDQSFDSKDNKNDNVNKGYKDDYTNDDLGNARDEKGKIYVCKFTRTPGGDEKLKRGNKGLVHVSANSQRNNIETFPYVDALFSWQDKHGRSVVILPFLGKLALEGTISVEDLCNDVLVNSEEGLD